MKKPTDFVENNETFYITDFQVQDLRVSQRRRKLYYFYDKKRCDMNERNIAGREDYEDEGVDNDSPL